MTRLPAIGALLTFVAIFVAIACVDVQINSDVNPSATPPIPLNTALGTSQQIELAQTAKALLAGKLSQITIAVGCDGSEVLTIEIRSLSGGLPTGTLLASQSFTEQSTAANPQFIPVTFTTPTTMVVDQQYAIIIKDAGSTNCAVARSATDVYANGQAFRQGLLTPHPTPPPPFDFLSWTGLGFDLALQTLMNPLP